MNSYYIGIVYATGRFVREDDKTYLIVRNTDSWYPKCIEKISKYKMYKSMYDEERLGRDQWIIKARDIHSVPDLINIDSLPDFCRAYIELHGVLDLSKRKNNKRGLRLRIYGEEYIITYLKENLPAKEKKIQYISNKIGGKYVGKTCVIYYQSAEEINDILDFIDGEPKNQKVRDKWKCVLNKVC